MFQNLLSLTLKRQNHKIPQNMVLVMFKGQAPWGDKTSITFNYI